MPDILVVQWARLGDLLHTRPLLTQLRQSRLEARIWLCFDARYETIVARFPEIDAMAPVDLAKLVACSRTDFGLIDSMDAVRNSLVSVPSVHSVINITNHLAAIHFSELVAADYRHGYGFQDDDCLISSLVETPDELVGQLRPVHVADVWRHLLTDQVVNKALHMSELPSTCEERTGTVIISDAGSPDRCFTDEAVRRMVQACRVNGEERVTLVGALRASQPFEDVLDLRGQTNLDSLYNTLAGARLVIGPDTGALHLAAALGCNTLGIYFGGADPQRTGQYSPKSTCYKLNGGESWDLADSAGEAVAKWSNGVAPPCVGSLTRFVPDFEGPWLYYKSVVDSKRSAFDGSSEVSIVITECGQVHYTDDLLKDLLDSDGSFEIVVVSSGLNSADRAHARSREGVKMHIAGQRLSFAEANNIGAAMCTREWLLFLNDDCRISKAALKQIIAGRESGKIIAPRLIYWDGTLQSAGITITEHGLREIDFANNHEISSTINAVCAALMLISRQLFENLSGFDQSFVNGYEDVDLCLRASLLGATCSIVDAEVVHFRGSTAGRYDHDELNLKLLHKQWPRTASRASAISVAPGDGAPIVFVSDARSEEAGPQMRWISPLKRLGLRENRDFVWLSTPSTVGVEALELVHQAQTIIAFRSIGDSALRSEVLKSRKRRSCKLLHDCDDLLVNRFNENSARASSRYDFEHGVRSLMDEADVLIAPANGLHDMHAVPKRKRFVLQTLPMPEHFVTNEHTRIDNVFRIGYAGGASHLLDLALISPVIETLLEDHDHVQFYWWGAYPPVLARHPQVRRGGVWIRNYATHLSRLQKAPIDLWIVPLASTEHNSVRSPVRLFEHLGAGHIALFSKVVPYCDVLGESDDLVVKNTLEAWHAAIVSIFDSNTRASVKESVERTRRQLLSASQCFEDYRALLEGICETSVSVANEAELCDA